MEQKKLNTSGDRLYKLFVSIVLITLAVVILVPVAWVFMASIKENAEFYELLKKYHVRPRGSMSALPELTDMTKNMATEIYWSDIALAMLSPDQL